MAKVTKVVLVADSVGEREFSFEHAERLLNKLNNGGWHLPGNSKFTYDKENGLRPTANNKGNSKSVKESSNTEGDKASE